jgi:hypothetical protein
MTRDTTMDKIEEVKQRLEDNKGEAAKSANAVFDNVFGFEIRHEDAPDPESYDDWDRYAMAAHDWALEELEQRRRELVEMASDLDIENYPPLGHDRPDDREQRDELDEEIAEIADALEDVHEVRGWLAEFEEQY